MRTLVRAAGARLIVISAPAGYGKTTLVANWSAAEASARSFAWATLRESDDDAVSLWTVVTAALDQAVEGLDSGRFLDSVGTGNPAEEMLCSLLLNELAACPERVVLALDDFHRLNDPTRRQQVAAFIDRLPPTVQVVLLGRGEPALPVTRYRAADDIVELDMNDLRFGREECGEVVRAVAGVRLHDGDLDELTERTEGWPAAIHLAGLSLREAPDPAAFVAGFAGTNRLIADYVAEEVLRPLPADLRAFLLRASVLDRFTAALCQAVTEEPDAPSMLDRLERSGTFLVPLDDHRGWYRFHRLFRDVLGAELGRDEPRALPLLHGRACDWHLAHGMTAEAIEHALAGHDLDRAEGLVLREWAASFSAGRFATVAGWLTALGPARLETTSAGAIGAAWAAAASGDRQSMGRWLRTAASLRGSGALPGGFPSAAFAVDLTRALFGSDGVPEALASAESACAPLVDPGDAWYGPSRAVLGYCRHLAGDPQAALQPLEEAVRTPATPPLFQVLALSALSLVTGELGRTARARHLADAAGEVAGRHDLADSALVPWAALALGAVLADEHRDDEAAHVLERALDLRRRTAGLSPWPTLDLLLAAARTRIDAGDLEGAHELADEARILVSAEADPGPRFRDLLALTGERLAAGAAAPTAGSAAAGGPAAGGPAAGPLTEREVTVLRLLRTGMSLREIGEQLYVSPNTVKTHTRSIYRKLRATSREEAIEHARDLGLL